MAGDLARPPGTRDYVGDHARERAVACAELAILFSSWGYERIETPCLEYAQTLSRGLHRDDARLLRLIDRDGQVLAVRSEMTTPAARVASRLRAGPGAAPAQSLTRLFYTEKTYAREHRDGSTMEVTQAGIELIGDASADADAQVIAILLEAMERLAVPDAVVVVGHVGFVNALLAQLRADFAERLRTALATKDLVAFSAALAAADVAPDKRRQLQQLLTLSTTNDGELLEAVAHMADCPDARASAEQLEALFAALRDHGQAGRVVLDLTL
ncbi:MAG: ATP phosphoribosyltransferase regulatory subunit, partial [Firmicutes bacterium]|nr:ATP phosphoribosyltransferase regulatory subunit [Bacillota bacterium]